jgi:hypothetical protein
MAYEPYQQFMPDSALNPRRSQYNGYVQDVMNVFGKKGTDDTFDVEPQEL